MKTNAGTKQGNKLWSAGGAGFSSATDDWATPPEVFAALDREFSFDLDVCASATNHKCARFFTVADDGLAQEWTGTVWMNPPYGRAIGDWMKKAADAADAGATVVCLVPARPDTAWWHDQVMARACEVRLVRGRLKFGNATTAAPFPSAVVVYRPGRSQLTVTPWTPPQAAKRLQTAKSAASGPKAANKPAAGNNKYVAGTLAIAVARSMNAKIGDAATTYAEQRSCPTSCRFFDGGGCYAEQGRLGFSVTAPLNRAAAMIAATPEDIARAEAAQIDGLKVKAGRPLRLHTLGDCKTNEAAQIVSDAAGRYVTRGGGPAWTYTHAWHEVDIESWGEVNVFASCETPEDVEAAHERGYPTAIVVEEFADKKRYEADGVNILPCPAQTKAGVTCASCKLCFNAPRLFDDRLTIAFEVHGTEDGKRRSRLALNDPNNPNRKLSSRTLIPKFIKVFAKQHGREPTNKEIASALERSPSSIAQMRQKLAAAERPETP